MSNWIYIPGRFIIVKSRKEEENDGGFSRYWAACAAWLWDEWSREGWPREDRSHKVRWWAVKEHVARKKSHDRSQNWLVFCKKLKGRKSLELGDRGEVTAAQHQNGLTPLNAILKPTIMWEYKMSARWWQALESVWSIIFETNFQGDILYSFTASTVPFLVNYFRGPKSELTRINKSLWSSTIDAWVCSWSLDVLSLSHWNLSSSCKVAVPCVSTHSSHRLTLR